MKNTKKPSKAFTKEMEKMYPKGAVISPKKPKATTKTKKSK
jgi:hypothetical protein